MVMDDITAQEVFDTAVCGIIAQGVRSTDADGNCVYLGPDGHKCAAGFLIPDDAYHPSMDSGFGTWFGELCREFPELPGHTHVNLVEQLQGAHDDAGPLRIGNTGFVAYFAGRAREIAERYRLGTTAMDAALAAREVGDA